VFVTGVGFAAARWRRRRAWPAWTSGAWAAAASARSSTWFLLGGDLYTAYTFIAVPARCSPTGAVSGFFAVPVHDRRLPDHLRLPAAAVVGLAPARLRDAGRLRRGPLRLARPALAVAVTGILATMPYIALQLVGIQAVLEVMGSAARQRLGQDLPLFIAFAVLAAYTYSSGLRAPALIAFVKDFLIYLVIIVAVVYIAVKIGFGASFDAAQKKMATINPATGKPTGVFIPPPAQYWAYASLALGSALALFMYPHSITAVLSSRSRKRDPPQRGDPAGVLTGARAAGAARVRRDRRRDQAYRPERQAQRAARRTAVLRGQLPELVRRGRLRGGSPSAPGAGGDHVDRGREPVHPQHLPGYFERTRPGAGGAGLQVASLVVKLVALIFVLSLDQQNAINFQLLGGIWILQTFPALVFGLYTRWFHRWALLTGWAVGMVYGTVAAYQQSSAATKHFGSSLARCRSSASSVTSR
jgi:SSS family solute:Na+ symporter